MKLWIRDVIHIEFDKCELYTILYVHAFFIIRNSIDMVWSYDAIVCQRY